MLFVAVIVVTLAYILASLGTYNTLPPNALDFIGVVVALALIVHLTNRFLSRTWIRSSCRSCWC